MCDFVASSPTFVPKAGIDCNRWCPYIVRHRAPLCVLLTHVWKPVLRALFIIKLYIKSERIFWCSQSQPCCKRNQCWVIRVTLASCCLFFLCFICYIKIISMELYQQFIEKLIIYFACSVYVTRFTSSFSLSKTGQERLHETVFASDIEIISSCLPGDIYITCLTSLYIFTWYKADSVLGWIN